MSDIEQAVNKFTAEIIANTIITIDKAIDLYTDKNGMVNASRLKGMLIRVLYRATDKGDNNA